MTPNLKTLLDSIPDTLPVVTPEDGFPGETVTRYYQVTRSVNHEGQRDYGQLWNTKDDATIFLCNELSKRDNGEYQSAKVKFSMYVATIVTHPNRDAL